MKSYTDIEQSKKLAKILPIENADMYYSHEFVNSAGDYYKLNIASEGYFDDEEFLGSDIPCWNLAVLLDVLPNYQLQTQDDGIGILCSCTGNFNIVTADNPIDACCEMILKLHELKIL